MTRRLEVNEAERTTLEPAVRHHPKPYVRERAAGLLKIAARARQRGSLSMSAGPACAGQGVPVGGSLRAGGAGGVDDPVRSGSQAPAFHAVVLRVRLASADGRVPHYL